MVSRARGYGWRLPVAGFAVLVIALASFAAGVAMREAFAQPTSGTIYACKGDRSGSLRIVQQGQQCQRGESPLSWNEQGPPGVDLTPSVSGSVGADGSVFFGRGFTAQRTGVGAYTIRFPAGTWDDLFSTVVTPFGGTTVSSITFAVFGDGSGELNVTLFTDAPFTFNATQIAP
jgi:hypothetical protein